MKPFRRAFFIWGWPLLALSGLTKLGIITSSTSYQYVKEVFGDSVSVLKLGMANPLPVKLLRDFAAKVDQLVVVEELDPRGEVREEEFMPLSPCCASEGPFRRPRGRHRCLFRSGGPWPA